MSFSFDRRRRGSNSTTLFQDFLQSTPNSIGWGSLQLTQQLVVKNKAGTDVTSTSTFTPADPSICSVSAGGLVTGLKNGNTTIHITNGALAVDVSVSVSQVPASITNVAATLSALDTDVGSFSPIVKDANNQTIVGASVTSVTGNSSIIGVSGLNWTGVGAGNTTITLTSGSVNFTVTVTVTHNSNTLNTTTGQHVMGLNNATPLVWDDFSIYTGAGYASPDAEWRFKKVSNDTSASQPTWYYSDTTKGGGQPNASALYTPGYGCDLANVQASAIDGKQVLRVKFPANDPTSVGEVGSFRPSIRLPSNPKSVWMFRRGRVCGAGDYTQTRQFSGLGDATSTAGVNWNNTNGAGFKRGPYAAFLGSGRAGLQSGNWNSSYGSYDIVSLNQNAPSHGINDTNISNTNLDTLFSDRAIYDEAVLIKQWLSLIDNVNYILTICWSKKVGTANWYRKGVKLAANQKAGTVDQGITKFYLMNPFNENYNHCNSTDLYLEWLAWACYDADNPSADGSDDPAGILAYELGLIPDTPSAVALNGAPTTTQAKFDVTFGKFTKTLRAKVDGSWITGQDVTIDDRYGEAPSASQQAPQLDNKAVAVPLNMSTGTHTVVWFALDGNGNADPTGISINVTIPASTVPDAPTLGAATSIRSNNATIPVTLASTGALPTGLAWQYSSDGGTTWNNGAAITLTGTVTLGSAYNEQVPFAIPNQPYSVRFAASNANGTGPWSNVISFTTAASLHTARASVSLIQAAPLGYDSALTKSAVFPLARNYKNTSNISNERLGVPGTGGINPYVQSTGGANQQSIYQGNYTSWGLDAGTIPAGTYQFEWGAYTESANAYTFAPSIYVYRPTTDSVVGYLLDSTAGLGSACNGSITTAGRVATFNLAASITVQDGDELVIEAWFIGNASDILHFVYGGNQAITNLGTVSGYGYNTRLVFPSNITFQV